jgi:hypothetical protein
LIGGRRNRHAVTPQGDHRTKPKNKQRECESLM